MDPGVQGRMGGYRGTWDGSWGSVEDVGQTMTPLPSPPRIASSNNLNKSESDQEDNDDINDNDWSYGSEKKGGEGSPVP